ncbi:hypothetical protein ACLIA0_09760 [Bacillaceae bacterium W0354]
MLVCSKCNSTQESGQFCGVCGGQLVEQNETVQNVDVQNVAPQNNVEQIQMNHQPNQQAPTQQPNETVENVKKELSNYWNYFLNFLKQPTKALNTNDQNFVNGLITLILYAFTFGLSLYFLINGLYKEMSSWFGVGESAPFFSITFRVMFFVALLVLSGLVSAFVMLKVAKVNTSIQTLVAQYGSLAVPFLTVNLLAVLTALASAEQLTTMLLMGGYLLFVFVTPALLVFEKATQVDVNGQRFYYSIGTVVITSVLVYILFDFVISSFLDKIGYNMFF